MPAWTIDSIGDRIRRVLDRWIRVPFYTLQYRTCEVGRARLDPGDLSKEIHDTMRLPEPQILSSEFELNEHDELRVVESRQSTLGDHFAEISNSARDLDLADALTRLLPSSNWRFTDTPTNGTLEKRRLGNSDFPARWLSTEVSNGSSATKVVFTHDLQWLQASSQFFGHFLLAAAQRELPLLFIVRKTSPAMFLVCKQLGIRVVQYYSPMVDTNGMEHARNLSETAGWPRSLDTADLGHHAVRGLIERHLVGPPVPDFRLIAAMAESASQEPGPFENVWEPTQHLLDDLLASHEGRAQTIESTERTPSRINKKRERASKPHSLFDRGTELTRIGFRV